MSLTKKTASATWLLTLLSISFGGERAVGQPEAPNNSEVLVIPKPLRVRSSQTMLSIESKAKIFIDADEPELSRIARMFADANAELSTIQWDVQTGSPPKGQPPFVRLTVKGANVECESEGYEIEITPESVTVRAPHAQGVYYGVQTLRQMLHTSAGEPRASGVVELPCVKIFDKPRFKWRGMHLDVSRHFMPLEFVKRYIDLLALHKFNTFHWHLTDDQGWRIKIKAYPRLAEIAAWRGPDDGRYGGFYTQDQIREIVRYAADRFITVVPEIEMPGHTQAVLAAYPELSCTGGPFEVAEASGIREDVFCAGNEATFEFLEGVLDEVCDLFPGKYVHIGGDECPKKRWRECDKCQTRIKSEGLADEDALQSYFIRRIEQLLNARGKRLIGWDEILEGGLAPGATVMSWRGTEGGIAAARQGHDVIMCPTSHCYFDYRQTDKEGEPGAPWAPVLDLRQVYAFEPTPTELSGDLSRHVLGAQGNLWTERMLNGKDVEYMAFPRACALAEVVWSPKESRDWPSFQLRLAEHLKRLDAMNVNYCKSAQPTGPGTDQ